MKKAILIDILQTISRRDGVLKPQVVVNEAREESSPLHDLFDWDNDSAGEKYRLEQARMLIRTVRIEYKGKEVGAYYNIQVDSVPQKGYYSLDQILSDDSMHQEVLRTAIVELKHWQEKYREIKELKNVINSSKLEEVAASI